ncbi:TetR/AcrR family transcriptional regulator [Mycobacterium sp. NAZ190054]|uniref:TetR/AcrR family transcriptional regulator n=1 Tax=Mycobacterium sp. NAZ190054 TaxID=1747766 RepID=UPI00079347F7|nr:TetR/AcrR family transcriptional regulator [Mycobacterium sp. NAZ190054]KWX69254.1 TetR family transcriptional regulator [Mycobacterium sp. NAZ190054]
MTRQPATPVAPSKAAARIVAAAVVLFAEQGYGATSLRDIAASLDLSPGAVYPHYKTKESLLFAISLRGHTQSLRAVTDAIAPFENPVDRLRHAVTAYVAWHARNNALARVVQYELRSLSDEHYREIVKLRRQTTETFREILLAGRESGSFSCQDPEATVLAITSVGLDVSRWFPTHAFADPDDLARRYADLALLMAGTRE